MKKIVLITGGFDPIHRGHLEYFKEAKKLGDVLVVGVNSDKWLESKKGRSFLPWVERIEIVKAMKVVDLAISFVDDDGTALDAIKETRRLYPDDKIIFANGGDRTKENIPEMSTTDDNIEFKFGIGGFDKKNSSSWILQEWKTPTTDRQWGNYRVLHENKNTVKVKELTVDPNKQLSMQRHSFRAEHWFVAEGTATVYTLNESGEKELLGTYNKFEHVHIDNTQWHQLVNEDPYEYLKVVEIQYGDNCVEEDIERK